MSLNHKKITNTKYAVKEVLKRLDEKRVDSFVNLLVEARPEEFAGSEDTVVDPFIIIKLMTSNLESQFVEFSQQLKTGEIVITDEVREKANAKIMAFESSVSKKKDETTH